MAASPVAPVAPDTTAAEKIDTAEKATRIGKGPRDHNLDEVREKKAPRFPIEIASAVKWARTELHGKNPRLKKDARPGAASAGDHIAVRAHIGKTVDGPVTAEKVLALTGLTFPRLCEVAKFAPGTDEDLRKLQSLGKTFAKDKNASWRSGRYLAGITAAYVRELRAAKTSTKK